MVEAIWPEPPPPSATKLVQVYVSQLRRSLGDGDRIETRGNGYALLDPSAVDAARFERLLAEGSAARREDNPELALSLLERALGLWRGPAYGEFAYEDFARSEAERLEELRVIAAEERFDAGLVLGRHADLLPELGAIAAEHPVREHLQAQAMLALYRAGGRRTRSSSTRRRGRGFAKSWVSSLGPSFANCSGGSSSRIQVWRPHASSDRQRCMCRSSEPAARAHARAR